MQKNSEIPRGAIAAPHRSGDWFKENCVQKLNEIINNHN
jgi:hypothetical protein